MDPVGVEAIAAKFGVRAYADEESLLADPEVEAVYIASPVHCHAAQIKKAAAAGKHVLCEKPLTLTRKQGEQAVEACRKHKVFLQEGYMMKFHGAHQRIDVDLAAVHDRIGGQSGFHTGFDRLVASAARRGRNNEQAEHDACDDAHVFLPQCRDLWCLQARFLAIVRPPSHWSPPPQRLSGTTVE